MPRKKPRPVRYTAREKKFLELLHKGFNLKNAALGAGYSPKNPTESGIQARNAIERKGGFDVYEAMGMTREQFIREHLAPGLAATETKFFPHTIGTGKKAKFVIEERECVAWTPRQRAQDMVLLIAGEYKREQENQATGVRVVILNGAHRPHRENGNGQPPIDVKIPSLTDGKQEPKK